MAPRAHRDDSPLLTPRQIEVLELMAKGLTNAEIGRVLGIRAGTAKVHVSRVIAALDVTNRTEAAVALHGLQASSEPIRGGGVPGFGCRPPIVVLPFENLSGDPEQDHFADGLVEDLTTRLAAWRWFPVIARSSAFAFRGQAIIVPEVCEQLGARYAIEGSTRRSADRVRIHVQLIDGERGEHVFAERYDRRGGDVFALQDEIVEAIVGALEPSLLRVEGLRALRESVASLDTWECFQRGLAVLHRQAAGFAEEALGHFDRALERDDAFAPAHAGRSMALYAQGMNAVGDTHFKATTGSELQQAFAMAAERFGSAEVAGRRAVELDPLDAAGHLGLGGGLALQGRLDGALAELEYAVDLNPSSPTACWSLGALLAAGERVQEAQGYLERAIRLSPRDPNRHHFDGALGALHFRLGRDEQALARLLQSVDGEPAGAISYLPLVPPCLAHLGRLEDAREAMGRVRERWPDWNLGLMQMAAPPETVERVVDGYRTIGWDLRDAGANA